LNQPSFAMSSIFSKSGSRSAMSELSHRNESQEDLTPTSKHASGSGSFGVGITVTQEVSISYAKEDTPFVHAALVGLVQGEALRRRPSRPPV